MNIIIPLILIAMIAFIYKAYLNGKIEDPAKNASILSIIAFRAYGIMTLLPLSTKAKDQQERKLRRIANSALVVFYGCLLIVFILSAFVKDKH
jgi:hypothetical protein